MDTVLRTAYLTTATASKAPQPVVEGSAGRGWCPVWMGGVDQRL